MAAPDARAVIEAWAQANGLLVDTRSWTTDIGGFEEWLAVIPSYKSRRQLRRKTWRDQLGEERCSAVNMVLLAAQLRARQHVIHVRRAEWTRYPRF
jgi:hypothetical protein